MEYEFIHDSTTGNASAKFSFEHQAIGPWLESEIGHDTEKLTQILTAIDDVEKGKLLDVLIAGKEYSLSLEEGDVVVQANVLFNGVQGLPDELIENELSVDEHMSASCGVDDFRELLLAWARFTKS